MRRSIIAGLALLALSACSTGRNYPAVGSPRFTGTPSELRLAASRSSVPVPDSLTVVTFNVKEGAEVARALESLAELPAADVLLLQEMDAPGTARIAEALGMAWVYYPASRRNGRGFGNAVLSRFPIEDDAKLVLSHNAWLAGTQRTATAATIRVGASTLRFYSVHLATPVAQSPGNRRAQFETVLDDAERFAVAVVGGDLNSAGVPSVAEERGWSWHTRDGPRTTWWGRIDHVVTRGLESSEAPPTGTGSDPAHASDHRPVWVRIAVPVRSR